MDTVTRIWRRAANAVRPAFMLLCLLAGPAPQSLAETKPAPQYTLGVLAQRSAVQTAQYWNPILGQIEKNTGIRILLKVARTPGELAQGIEHGDYALVSSHAIFRPTNIRLPYHILLRPQAEVLYWQIITPETSNASSLRDLEGQRIGLPAGSPIDQALPMDALMRQGISVKAVPFETTESIVAQFKEGNIIAAAISHPAGRTHASREYAPYRVLWESPPFPGLPIAVHNALPKQLAETLRQAFAQLDDTPEGLQVLEAAAQSVGQRPPFGFRPASASDYQAYLDFFKRTPVKDKR